MSDLELLQQETPPRRAAAARLARRVDSIAGFIAYGVLWLMLSLVVSSLPIFVGMRMTGPNPSSTVVDAVLLAWVILFVVMWLPFGMWVVRRRRAARALVRDGVLVDGTIDHAQQGSVRGGTMFSAGIRFTVAGEEQRAVFAVAHQHVAPGNSMPVLWAPGARHALVFPGGAAHAVAARLAHDIAIERGGERTVVTFRRGAAEKLFVGLLAIVLPQMTFIGLRLQSQPPSLLRCDRDKDECTLSGSDIFGGHWSNSYPVSGMLHSEVRLHKTYDEVAWVVRMKDSRTRDLAGFTDRTQQKAAYHRQSDALNTFIGDRAERTFEARFEGMGGPSSATWIAIGLVLGYILFSLVNGWRTQLAFDRAAGTLTITRSPALLPPARRTLPLASIARADASSGSMWLVFASLPTLTLRLIGSDGKVLFKRKQATSDDARREIAAINELLGAKSAVAR
jgi:hypothetical protein